MLENVQLNNILRFCFLFKQHFIYFSIKALKPTDKTAWDDDDDDPKAVRKSSWDFPTPLPRDTDRYKKPSKDYKGRPYDDTVRATPHK